MESLNVPLDCPPVIILSFVLFFSLLFYNCIIMSVSAFVNCFFIIYLFFYYCLCFQIITVNFLSSGMSLLTYHTKNSYKKRNVSFSRIPFSFIKDISVFPDYIPHAALNSVQFLL